MKPTLEESADSHRSRTDRIVQVLGGLALSTFFFTLMVLILSAPMRDSPIITWSIRLFVFFMFGAVGVAGLIPLWNECGELLALRRRTMLDAYCLGCGELCNTVQPCKRCGHPPDARDAHWSVKSTSRLLVLVMFGISAALLSLGVFMLYGSFQQQSVLLASGCFLLGLLLCVVGAIALRPIYALFTRDETHLTTLQYTRSWHHEGARVDAFVQFTPTPGAMTCSGVTRFSEIKTHPVLAPSSALQRGLARLIATWVRDDRIAIHYARTLTWKRLSISPLVAHAPGSVYRAPYNPHHDFLEHRYSEEWSFLPGEQPLEPALRALGIDPPSWAIYNRDARFLGWFRDCVHDNPDLRKCIEAMDVGSQHLDEPFERLVLAAIQRSA